MNYFYVKVALARSALGDLDFPRTPSIWHALLRCMSRLRSTGNLVLLGADSRFFYEPSYLTVTCSAFAFGVQDYGLSWEKTSGNAVFSASWFNNGYMFLPVYVVVGTVSENSAMLVPQCYMLYVSHGVSCWLRCTSRCGFQALMPASWPVWTRGTVVWFRSYSSSWSCSFLGGGPDVQKTVVFHSCSSCLVVYMPFVGHDKFC